MGWIVLMVFLAILFAVFARVDNWQRDWITNWARTDPQADTPDLRPLHSELPPDALRQIILDWVAERAQWEVAESGEVASSSATSGDAEPPSARRLHLVHRTLVFRFRDDVWVTLKTDPETGGSVLTAESRSRIGSGDLGQNPRNIKELVAGIRSRR